MKKIILFLILLSIAIPFSGCGYTQSETVSFFYPRASYFYDRPDGIISTEERDASGHTEDTQYLLLLYLMGPSNQNLVSAFPSNTRLISGSINGNRMLVNLSDSSDSLSDAEYSLACTCLALTCMKATGTEEIIITSGSRTQTIREDMLLLYEEPFPATSETEEP